MREHLSSKSKNKNKYKNLSCPNCKSKNIIRRGFRKTQNRGKIQRYSCKDCNYRLVKDEGFYRMRNSPQKITLCLDLFYCGLSTREIQEHFKAFYSKNVSWVSIYKWIKKFSLKIAEFTDKLKLKTGSYIEVDELEYHRRTNPRKKGVGKEWFIDSVDCKTRYMVGSKYFKSRGQKEIREVMNKVKYKTEGYVTTITTDGYTAYESVVKKTFGGSNKKQEYAIRHNKVIASKGEGFNIMIERLHNSIRHRTKTFRGFHGCVESAESIMKCYEIFYNSIRKHQAIKKCPYELAISELKLTSENKGLELIKLSRDMC